MNKKAFVASAQIIRDRIRFFESRIRELSTTIDHTKDTVLDLKQQLDKLEN